MCQAQGGSIDSSSNSVAGYRARSQLPLAKRVPAISLKVAGKTPKNRAEGKVKRAGKNNQVGRPEIHQRVAA